MSIKELVKKRLAIEPTPVPEWGEGAAVIVRGFTAQLRLWGSKKRKGQSAEKALEEYFVRALAHSLCDPETGRPIWTPDEMREVIETDDTGAIVRLAEIMHARSSMSPKAVEKAERDF